MRKDGPQTQAPIVFKSFAHDKFMKAIFWLVTAICTLGFWSEGVAGDTALTLPEKLDSSDQVIVYKIEASDSYSLRHGKQFHDYLIVSESESYSGQVATNLYRLCKQAFPAEKLDTRGAAILPCMFLPRIGVSFRIGGQRVDAAVSFNCNEICFFNGEVPIRTSDLNDIRNDLLAQLRMIFPKDAYIQALK